MSPVWRARDPRYRLYPRGLLFVRWLPSYTEKGRGLCKIKPRWDFAKSWGTWPPWSCVNTLALLALLCVLTLDKDLQPRKSALS